MDDAERLELIQEALEKLYAMGEDCVILVEGPNDVRALRNVGIDGEFFRIQSDGGPIKAAEYVASRNRDAVILTDWDDKGDIIAADVSEQLSALGVRHDLSVRKDLAALSKKFIKDVESLDSMLGRMSESGRT